ncbi:MAG: HAMP domain-containing histidine kinase [Candidatus Aenigmarchaeota archaeon]|nr:HAMP domain-containing histidine kinase [Candidatus Aenigmarchaeota archaeon]
MLATDYLMSTDDNKTLQDVLTHDFSTPITIIKTRIAILKKFNNNAAVKKLLDDLNAECTNITELLRNNKLGAVSSARRIKKLEAYIENQYRTDFIDSRQLNLALDSLYDLSRTTDLFTDLLLDKKKRMCYILNHVLSYYETVEMSLESDKRVFEKNYGDALLSHALKNLISNVARYGMRKNGKVHAWIEFYSDGSNKDIVLVNRGVIDPAAALERGYTTGEAVGGQGFGLNICHELARSIGGKISIGYSPTFGLVSSTISLPKEYFDKRTDNLRFYKIQ